MVDEASVVAGTRRLQDADVRKKIPSVIKVPELSSDIHPTRVALRLRALREAVGLGPSEFADTISFDRSAYSRIEKGAKPLHQYLAYDIAVLYGVSMEFIYRGRTEDRDLPEKYATAIRQNLLGLKR